MFTQPPVKYLYIYTECRVFRVLRSDLIPSESLHSSNKDNSDSNPVSLNLSIAAKAQLDLRGWVQHLCMWEYAVFSKKQWQFFFVAVSPSQRCNWSGFSPNFFGVCRILHSLLRCLNLRSLFIYRWKTAWKHSSRNKFELIMSTWETLTCSWMPTCTHFKARNLAWRCLGVVSSTYKQRRTWMRERREHTSYWGTVLTQLCQSKILNVVFWIWSDSVRLRPRHKQFCPLETTMKSPE